MGHREACAEKLLEITPRVMASIRSEMRASAEAQLTVPQFRVMVRLAKGPSTHKEVAEWIGVTLPTLSKMIEVLIEKGLLRQEPLPGDRRKFRLSLTPQGQKTYDLFRSRVKKRFSEKLSDLTASEANTLSEALLILGNLFHTPKVHT